MIRPIASSPLTIARNLATATLALALALPALAQAQNLVGHWSFNGNLNDSSGRNNQVRRDSVATYAPGPDGQALDLSGRPLTIPNGPSLEINQFVLDYSVYLNSPGNYLPTVSKGAAWQINIVAGVDSEGKAIGGQSLQFCIGGACKTSSALERSPVARWMEVEFSYDGTIATGHVDGATVVTFEGNFQPGNIADDIQLGSASGNGPSGFDGLIRDLKIYDAAPKPSLIAHANSGATLGTNSILLGSAATTSSVVLSATSAWTATANDSFLHISAGSTSGAGSALVLFSVDALNSAGSRTGTLTIAGLTLTVTQTGTNYSVSTSPIGAGSLLQGLNGSTLTVDSAGNLYVVGDIITASNCDATFTHCDYTVTDGLLQKIDATTQAVTTLGSGLHLPGAVAVDSSGNVYVADSGNNVIKKWTAATQQFTTFLSGLIDPEGVAVDTAGNLYIANTGNHEIKKWVAATQQLTTLISGRNYVPGVAVDIAGNVYFTESDTGVNAPGSNGSIKKWTASTQLVTALVALNHPYQLTVDGSGNLYFMDPDFSQSGYPHRAGMWSPGTQQLTYFATEVPANPGVFPLQRGVAVDRLGNVYLSAYDYSLVFKIPYAMVPSGTIDEPILSGADALPPVLPVTTDLSGGNAPSIDPVNWLTLGTLANGVVPFSYTANTTGSPRSARIWILGVASTITQDRTTVPNVLGQTQAAATSAINGVALAVGNVSTVLSATVPAGQVITSLPFAGTQLAMGSAVNLVISAGSAGLGSNAIQVDSSAAGYSVVLSASVGWSATANNSFLHLAPGSSSGTGSSLVGFTVDGFTGTGSRTGTLTIAGLTFTVTQWGTNYVRVLQPTTLVTAPPTVANGVTVDTAGRVLVIDTTLSTIDFWNPTSQQLIPIASGFNAPHGLARDSPSSNDYIADTGNNAVKVRNGITGVVSTILSGLNAPRGVAVDSAGDVYIADTGNNALKKWSATTGAVTTLATGLNQPSALAADRAGNIYIADNGSLIKVWSVATGAVTTLVSGLNAPNGVAVDGSGNLYISDGAGLQKWNVVTGQVETLDPGYLYIDPFGQGNAIAAATAVAADTAGNAYADFSLNLNANYPALVKYSVAFVPAVPVPNVVSQTQSAATAAITGVGLVAGTVTNVISATVPVGSVVSTSPAAGTVVAVGSAVNLAISIQAEQVPNVVGQTQAAATTAITNAGLVLGAVTTPYSATVPSGIVISQNPVASTTVQMNSTVDLVVSAGPQPVLVPDVIGQTPGAANSTITSAAGNLTVGSISTVVSRASLKNPGNLISDLNGNVYIADTGNNAVEEWNAATGQMITLVSGLNQPGAIAIDKVGNLYIADTGNNAIKKWDAVTHQVTTLVSTGLNHPQGVVVDRTYTGTYSSRGANQVGSNGDVYISDTGNNAVKVWTAATQQVTTLVSTGLNQPTGLGWCIGAGLYIADTGNNAIKYFGGSLSTIVSAGLNHPTAVVCAAYADNATGFFVSANTDFIPYQDLYIADTGNNAIKFWPSGNQPRLFTVASGLNQPLGVASDGLDTVWVADTGLNRLQTLKCKLFNGGYCGQSVSLMTPSTLFRTVAPGTVVSTNPTVGSSVNVGSAVNLVVDGGLAGLGSNSLLVGSGSGSSSVFLTTSAALGTWTATANDGFLHLATGSGSGSASVAFTIDAFGATGVRTGTLTIDGLTFTVTQVGTDYVASSQLATPTSGGFNLPDGVAVDGAGNVYIADTFQNNAVKKWSPATGQITTLISTGLTNPHAIAVDGAGNLYVSDDTTIQKWSAATQQVSTLLSGLTTPSGLALDSAGNLYYSNNQTTSPFGTLNVWTATTGQVTVLASGLSQPRGLALDSAGNIYYADGSDSAIRVWNAVTGQVTTLVGTGILRPWGVAVDNGTGDVYFSDTAHSAIDKYSMTTQLVSTLAQSATPGGADRYRGVALDGLGNIYYAETGASLIGHLSVGYVSSGSLNEPNTAGTGTLPPVIPLTANLTGTFAPVSDLNQPWLTISSVANGVVNFSFAANSTGSPRTGHITILGTQFTINQGLPVAVPNVVGQTQAAATAAITGAGLVFGTVTTASSSTVAAGNVISSNPAATTQVNPGSAVNLVVSTGPAQVAVPNVVGQTQLAATSAITGAGLVLGTVTTASSNTVVTGSVISTNPAATTLVNSGSAVNLVISTGLTIPTLTWATPANQTFGGALSTSQLNAKSNVPGIFVYTPAAGTVLPVGNSQTLSATFTPTDTVNYASASISTTINILPGTATGIQLLATYVLKRDISNNIVVQVTVANAGAIAAPNFTITSLKIGTTSGAPIPQVLGNIASGGQVQTIITVPGSAGVAGAAGTLSLTGTATGGSLTSNARITLP